MNSSDSRSTKEKQYQVVLEKAEREGIARLGIVSSLVYGDDPRRFAILLARYKFVAKMFSGYARVLEIGCGDGFASRVVKQEVGELVACDFDPIFIEDAKERFDPQWPVEFRVHDMLEGAVAPGGFDGVYCCDVLEHIAPEQEDLFIGNAVRSLGGHGTAIFGIPSLESQAHASPRSVAGHVNCKSGAAFKSTLQRHFENVFVFSMNDEVVHTGFYPMAHYLFALCCGPKR